MPNRRSDTHSGRGDGEGGVSGLPASLRDLPWELPHTFLGLDEESAAFHTARALILPVPYESTVSYGGGTRRGPRAIVDASRYVELYDQEHGMEPGPAIGIHTFASLELSRDGAKAAMDELQESYARILEAAEDRFVVMLGGEHAISSPAILALAAHRGERISVLQLDAHADLRPEFEGSIYSHASAMARVLPVADVVGVGIRGICAEEVEVAESHDGVTLIYADEMWENDDWMERALDALGDVVYLTFDIDYFDPSFVPSTGTPEPGGGDWYRTLRFLRRVFRERTVVAGDVVELAPTPGLHAPDFLAAKLVYKLLGYRFESEF